MAAGEARSEGDTGPMGLMSTRVAILPLGRHTLPLSETGAGHQRVRIVGGLHVPDMTQARGKKLDGFSSKNWNENRYEKMDQNRRTNECSHTVWEHWFVRPFSVQNRSRFLVALFGQEVFFFSTRLRAKIVTRMRPKIRTRS